MSDRIEFLLREAGIECRVEVRDRMAILVPDPGYSLDRDGRALALRVARDAGFTHVSLELDPERAALSRD